MMYFGIRYIHSEYNPQIIVLVVFRARLLFHQDPQRKIQDCVFLTHLRIAVIPIGLWRHMRVVQEITDSHMSSLEAVEHQLKGFKKDPCIMHIRFLEPLRKNSMITTPLVLLEYLPSIREGSLPP